MRFWSLAKGLLNICFSRLLAGPNQKQGHSSWKCFKEFHSHYSMSFKWSVVLSSLLSGFLPGLFIAICTCCRNWVLGCTWEAWCSMDLSWKNRELLIGGTLLIPLKGYRACCRRLKSFTGIYFSSKLCMQNNHKKGGSMKHSCPALALPHLGNLLWRGNVAHNISHPCSPPSLLPGKEQWGEPHSCKPTGHSLRDIQAPSGAQQPSRS